jgi:gamma-glutamylaminecyclotransferase
MTRLFVYGTLKRGCKNHRHLAGQIYVGEARTVAGYRLYDLGDYPGMVAAPDDTEGVTGELWLADDAALARLDDFEGVHEGLYRRVPVALLNIAETESVHTYLYARPTAGRPTLGPTWRE